MSAAPGVARRARKPSHRRASGVAAVPGAGTMGLFVLIASLSMLFGASVVGHLVVWHRAETWAPRGVRGPSGGLAVSTVILLAAAGTMQQALRSIRRGRVTALRRWMLVTGVLGLAFLGMQAVNWRMLVASLPAGTNVLYEFTFFLLTGLHAAHVVGGLVPLAVVTARAFRGAYSWADHSGVLLCAIYWHFLDAVWLVLFAVILLTR